MAFEWEKEKHKGKEDGRVGLAAARVQDEKWLGRGGGQGCQMTNCYINCVARYIN
jgi:hypothetical protein